jgi:hypothetical protein
VSTGFFFDPVRNALWTGQIAVGTDVFYVLLVTSIPDRGWTYRSQVLNEVPAGGGYVTGGIKCTLSLSLDPVGHLESIIFAKSTFTNVSITGVVGAVVYKKLGGPPTQDILIGFIDFDPPATITGTVIIPQCAFEELDLP